MKHAVVALVLGLVIYLLARDGLVIHALGSARIAAPDVIAYQLPDALWQYAFCMVVYAIWRDRRALLLPLALGLVTECVIGTFDVRDVIALCLAALVATVQIHSARRSELRHSESTA